jgi:alpha-D-xyloside xylohydrolase
MQFQAEGNALIARRGGETLRIEGWGRDSLRVRAVMYDGWTGNDWALTEKPEQT